MIHLHLVVHVKVSIDFFYLKTFPLVEKYGTYTTVNDHIRAVYAPYFHHNPGRFFTTVCNENTACIRPYTA
jgi:hypothetical protein